MNTGNVLIEWYRKNKRELPWRETSDPYKIWVSEVIMQQTRINQGLPYYNSFIEKFPTIQKLAESSLDDVFIIWQGLGYYSRARNMHQAAQQIVNEYQGEFPNNSKALLKIKGIGIYTSAAISSICFNENIPAIDGNVYRVISRLFNIEDPIDKRSGKEKIEKISIETIKNLDSGTYNQSIMDFGALICTPTKPKCIDCPLQPRCMAYLQNTINDRPIKSAKTTQRIRYFFYIYFHDKINTLILQRSNNDIWKGLFEFPLWEKNSQMTPEEFLQQPDIMDLINGLTITNIDFQLLKPHKLTHQHIVSTFIEIQVVKLPELNGSIKAPIYKLEKYAFPQQLYNYINKPQKEK